MLDQIIQIVKPFAEYLAGKIPMLGTIGASGIAICMVVGILIEIVEAVAKLTPTPKDDEAAAKIKKVKDGIIAVLEVIPHANIPIASGLEKAIKLGAKLASAVKGAIQGWMQSE